LLALEEEAIFGDVVIERKKNRWQYTMEFYFAPSAAWISLAEH